MAIEEIRSQEGLDTIWSKLVFTESRLLADGMAAHLAQQITAIVTAVDRVRDGQKTVWRNEIQADAKVSAADDYLDDVVGEFSKNLLFVLNDDRSHARFVRYFKDAPNQVIRMGLESELAKVRDWPTSVQTEPEAQVNAFAQKLRNAVQKGDEALAARTSATTARVDHRTRDIETVVTQANQVRKAVYLELQHIEQSQALPKGWADRFFTHRVAKAKQPEPTPPNELKK